MAKVKLNPIFAEVHGKVGNLVLKQYGNEVVVTRIANPTGQASSAQLAHQERFRAAASYGKLAMMDPATRALYQAAAQARNLPVFAVVVADFFNAPKILSIDTTEYTGVVGSRVEVLANDDFAVAGVQVKIAAAETVVEEGAAVETPVDSGRYYYTATQAVPAGTPLTITVTVTDRPGNTTMQTATK